MIQNVAIICLLASNFFHLRHSIKWMRRYYDLEFKVALAGVKIDDDHNDV